MAGAASASSPPLTPKSPKLQPPLLERAKGPSGLDKIVLRDPRGFSADAGFRRCARTPMVVSLR